MVNSPKEVIMRIYMIPEIRSAVRKHNTVSITRYVLSSLARFLIFTFLWTVRAILSFMEGMAINIIARAIITSMHITPEPSSPPEMSAPPKKIAWIMYIKPNINANMNPMIIMINATRLTVFAEL